MSLIPDLLQVVNQFSTRLAIYQATIFSSYLLSAPPFSLHLMLTPYLRKGRACSSSYPSMGHLMFFLFLSGILTLGRGHFDFFFLASRSWWLLSVFMDWRLFLTNLA
ncbi:hypothetical protein BO86DRAFT_122772 [Aspergillus japonicus CBS 114.51]|uniref:Uncharacterized protein n=1 Tax=Aspergillus japonicus CBS 114.51 TaxID=1448312 RepID=A0A8T8WYL3_ASPJA|nr:hypothetical protein BO86DRAFT_122772 [Aspergillus japonicus CBS 114.51]RAH80730.1 hypothetical protein BO86DRAFT_122772 [Aspergillus japonicus CBS 114.51]